MSKFRITCSRLLKITLLIWKYNFWRSSIWVSITLIVSMYPAFQIWLNKIMINSITDLSQLNSTATTAIFLVLVYYISNYFVVLLRELEKYNFAVIKEVVDYDMRNKIVTKASQIPLSHYDNPLFHDSIQLAQTSASKSGIDMVKNIFSISGNLLSMISMIAVLYFTHWILPVALVISSLPGIIFLFINRKKSFNLTVENSKTSRQLAYAYRLMTHRDNAKELRLFNTFEFIREKWKALYHDIRKRNINQTVIEGKANILGQFILTLSSAILAVTFVLQISKGLLTIGDYVALTGAVVALQSVLLNTGSSLSQIYGQSLFVNNVFDFLELPVEDDEENSNVARRDFPQNFEKIVVSNLSFSLPNSDTMILKNINLTVKRGEKIVIVGENGAGKSTLALCLLGLYKATTGKILIDDIDVNSISQKSLSKNITATFQDFIKYQLTIRENIGFGDIDSMTNDTGLNEALKYVGLYEKVQKLPKGLDTPVGKEFLGGQEISGGQWQKIALARSLSSGAHILIWDEPTASIDPLSEKNVLETLFKLTVDKSCIIISHRLLVAEMCDRVIVLKNGEIIEQGTHNELLKLNGEYSKMYYTNMKRAVVNG